jgi:hypothetical protein
MKICPICETENQPAASHCEVCGERLGAPAPGEVVAPEENVLGLIGHKADAGPATLETPVMPIPEELPETAEADGEVSEEELLRQFAALEERSALSRAAAPAPTIPDTPPAPEAITEPAPEPQPSHRPVSAAPELVSKGMPTARMVVYKDKQPAYTHPIVNDETLIGRYDALSGAEPELDLTDWDDEAKVSRKHAFIYRMNGEHFLYPVSNAGTQVGSTIVEMGTRHKLADGDVVILSMAIAMKFHSDPLE